VPSKTSAQLALDEKIDLARTLLRFKARRQSARELNDIEDRIKKAHDAEVASGSFSQIDLDSIGVGSLTKEVESGSETLELASGNADDKAA
jgi:hypothetical protein